MSADESYRVVVRLPVPLDHLERIIEAFPGAKLIQDHDEGRAMVLEVPA